MAKIIVLIGTLIALLANTALASGAPVVSMESDITKLAGDISRSQKEIFGLDGQLESTTKDIIHTYQKLDAQEIALKTQRRALNVRIGEVYKNYDELFLGIFLDARSFNDVWKRLSFLAKVNEADGSLLTANKLRLDQVRRLKQDLARKKQEQIDLKRRKQTEFLGLQAALLQKKALLETKLKEIRASQAAAMAATTGTIVAQPAP